MEVCSVDTTRRKHLSGKAYQQPRIKRRKVEVLGIAQPEALCYSIQRRGEDAFTCQGGAGSLHPCGEFFLILHG